MRTACVEDQKKYTVSLKESMFRENAKSSLSQIPWSKRSSCISTLVYIFTFVCCRKHICNSFEV